MTFFFCCPSVNDAHIFPFFFSAFYRSNVHILTSYYFLFHLWFPVLTSSPQLLRLLPRSGSPRPHMRLIYLLFRQHQTCRQCGRSWEDDNVLTGRFTERREKNKIKGKQLWDTSVNDIPFWQPDRPADCHILLMPLSQMFVVIRLRLREATYFITHILINLKRTANLPRVLDVGCVMCQAVWCRS